LKYQTQIVVAGGGAAGLSAAVAAAEKGASVIVVESNAAIGGNGFFPRGVFAVDSPVQRRKLIFADADKIFMDCMNYSHWKLDARIIRTLIDKSGNTIEWLEKKGVAFTDVVHHIPNQTPEVFHITDSSLNAGKAVINAFRDYCDKAGVTILTNTRAKKLLLSENGIDGLLCENKSGEEIVIHADKTIISTGGFAGNSELISKFYPNVDLSLITKGGGMKHNGDGLIMAVEAGADIEEHFAMEMAAPKIKGHAPLNLLIGKPQNLWVNCFGRRFANEGIVYDFTKSANACLRQPKADVWVVFDSAIKQATLADGRDIIELIHIPPNAEENLEQGIADAQKDGTLKVSDSIEEIAEFIGCESTALTETIHEYNSCCEHSRDGIFAKEVRYLKALNSPPYYAVKAGVDMLITHGGIRVNEAFEALNADQQVLHNLYVAGVDFGGADADIYNMSMSGHGFGFAINSGRIAGENAAKAL